MDAQKCIENNIIYQCVTGSFAYRLNTENSDTDIRSIFIPPPEYVFGINVIENVKPQSDIDIEYISLRKVFTQWCIGALNWIELLWVDDDMIQIETQISKTLRAKRDMFTTQRVIHKTIGFMNAMIKRYEQSKRTNNPNINKELMHAVRIGRMVLDFTQSGILVVDRSSDREHLMDIRYGNIPYDIIVGEVNDLISKLENSITTLKWNKVVPEQEANQLLVSLHFEYWNCNTPNRE